MPQSIWDSIPSETTLHICSFLSPIDLLNLCTAYRNIEQLVLCTAALWRNVHLPYPDPQLHNYPGWRRCLSADQSLSSSQSAQNARSVEQSSGIDNTMATHQSVHSHFIDGDDIDLPNLGTTPDVSSYPEFIAWILLDILDLIPLHYTQQLSFDSPPCRLCVYPCIRLCPCECHQNEQDLYKVNSSYQFQNYLNTWNPLQQDRLAPLSLPLQNLLGSGLVDFNRHIDVQSSDQTSTMPIVEANIVDQLASRSVGNSYLPIVSHVGDITDILHDELSLEDALQQLADIEADQTIIEVQTQYMSSQSYPETPIYINGTFMPYSESIEVIQENEHRLSDIEKQKDPRQKIETRMAYLHALLLMQVLSLRELGSLETLRAPWWPATRIYIIRQQLERWSLMIERTIISDHNVDEIAEQQDVVRPNPLMLFQQELSSTSRDHWTNCLSSEESDRTGRAPSFSANRTRHEPEAIRIVDQQTQESEALARNPSFPLANLTKFTLRYGGEVSTHDSHCLGASAMILTGQSLMNRSQEEIFSYLGERKISDSADASTSQPPSSPCFRRLFRYCSHCGSQYLCTNSLCKSCFCERRASPMSS